MNNIGKNVDSMNFEELRSFVKVLANSVQELSDLYAKTKREYNDMLYNLSRDNLSIEYIQEEKEFVNSTVGDKMKDYSTIEQTEEKIKLTVGSSVSSLKQYSDAELSNATRVESIDEMEWQDKIYFIENNDGSKTYYVYNALLQIWTPIINYVGQKYSTIEQTDEKIASSVISNKEYVDTSLTKYSTTEQTAEMIQSKVEEEIGNAGGGIDLTQYTRIDQTADAITQTAYRGINLSEAIEISGEEFLPDEYDGNEYFISHDGFGSNSERTYYAYNYALGKYMPILDGQSIYTVFKQTADKFEFKGNVIIDGDLCVLRNIRADRLYSRDYPNGYYMKIYGEFGDFGIFSPDAATNGNFSQGCILGAYNNLAEAILVINSQNVMAVDRDEVRAMNKKWNFSGVDVEGIGVVPVFG